MVVGKLYNLARMTTATAGTGTITLGSAAAGYLSFSGAGVANTDVISYGIIDGSNSECGTGTYTSAGTTLTRTVTKSTNSDAAISLSGNAQVFIMARAEDLNDAGLFTTGTLGASRLPNPSASTLGGVQSITSTASNFLTSISTSGVPAKAQPAFSDISGSATAAQLPVGSILQVLQTTYATNADLTTSIPWDDTTPLSSEGTQILSQAITPTDNTNKILITAKIWGNHANGEYMSAALFRSTTCIDVLACGTSTNLAARQDCLSFDYLDSPASSSAQTYTIRVGGSTATACRLNGSVTSRKFGGAAVCTLTATEIAV